MTIVQRTSVLLLPLALTLLASCACPGDGGTGADARLQAVRPDYISARIYDPERKRCRISFDDLLEGDEHPGLPFERPHAITDSMAYSDDWTTVTLRLKGREVLTLRRQAAPAEEAAFTELRQTSSAMEGTGDRIFAGIYVQRDAPGRPESSVRLLSDALLEVTDGETKRI